jgi:hypothetical protein
MDGAFAFTDLPISNDVFITNLTRTYVPGLERYGERPRPGAHYLPVAPRIYGGLIEH